MAVVLLLVERSALLNLFHLSSTLDTGGAQFYFHDKYKTYLLYLFNATIMAVITSRVVYSTG